MSRKQTGFGMLCSVLICIAGLTGCHAPAKNGDEKEVTRTDSGKTLVKPQLANTDVRFITPIDTIIGKDTLKVKWYQNGKVWCSLNSLNDTITNSDITWDPIDLNYLKEEGLKRIIFQGAKAPLNCIIADRAVLISLVDWKGRAVLFLLNRTKNALKFARQDDANPIVEESGCIYVDLKNNIILNHGGQDSYDHSKKADAGDDTREGAPYWIYRFKIKDNHFVQTDLDTSFFKQFSKLDLGNMEDNRTFYTVILKNENWQRDRYDTSSTQKIIAIDTAIGKEKIRVSYDNSGQVICSVGGAIDTAYWDETWKGHDWSREKVGERIIIPGENKPRAFILNDSILLFTLLNSNGKAVLFLFTRSDTTLDSNVVSTAARYVYVDLKHDTILSYIDSDKEVNIMDDEDTKSYKKVAAYGVDLFQIKNKDIADKGNCIYFFKDGNPGALVWFDDFSYFYYCVSRCKKFTVNDFLHKNLFRDYIYYSQLLK